MNRVGEACDRCILALGVFRANSFKPPILVAQVEEDRRF